MGSAELVPRNQSALLLVLVFLSLGCSIFAAENANMPFTPSNSSTIPDPRLFHVMPHSHVDVEWYWTYATTKLWVTEILDGALALFRKNANFRFTQDQVFLLRDYWDDLDPDEKAFFKQIVAEKKLDLAGGMFVMPEVAEPSGEALIRQILYGQEWLANTFGVRSRCGYFIDTFGQIPQIPQILRRAGYQYNLFWRDIPAEVDFAGMPSNFYWQSPDGSRILTHWLPGGYDSTYAQIKKNLAHNSTGHLLLPFGGDVARPPKDFADIDRTTRNKLERLGVNQPAIVVATATEYMDTIAKEATDLPVLSYDFNPPFRAADLRGTYDNRIELKKRNRAAEASLYNAEVVATIAWTKGDSYAQAEFSELWEKLLFTHFHDIIGGSHHDPVYVAAMERLQSVLDGSQSIIRQNLPKVLSANSSDKTIFDVFNTLSFPRNEICRMSLSFDPPSSQAELLLQDEKGELVRTRQIAPSANEVSPTTWIEFLAKDVPATGCKVYHLPKAATKREVDYSQRTVGEDFIENTFFRVRWESKTGDLVSIFDKKQNLELLSGSGNVIIAAEEKDPDLEGMIRFTGASTSLGRVASIQTSMDALGVHVQMNSEFQGGTLERKITLLDQLDRIDFQTTLIDFKGSDVLIKVSFPLSMNTQSMRRTYETPLAATERPDGHFAAQTWVDCSDGQHGVALLNRGTPGYWITGNRLELVLLRSFANYTGYQQAGLKKNVPGYESSTQTELAREHGTHEFEYSLVSHVGEWRSAQLCERGQSWNTPFVTCPGSAQTASPSFIRFGHGFTLTALKRAQNGEGIVIRGYETTGQAHSVKMILPPKYKKVSKASLLEEPLEEMSIENGVVQFPCAPHEIVTFVAQF